MSVIKKYLKKSHAQRAARRLQQQQAEFEVLLSRFQALRQRRSFQETPSVKTQLEQ